MRLLWIRDIVTTSGHSSIASINLPDSAKHKPLYFIKGQFVKMDASTEDEEIDALLDKYELNQIKDYDLIKKGNVASCVGKNGGKISLNNCFINCEYNPETRPYKLGCSVFVAVKE